MIDTPDTVSADEATEETVQEVAEETTVSCVWCERELRPGPNGAKATAGGYTCWSGPETWTKHVPNRPFLEEVDPVPVTLGPGSGQLVYKLEGTARQLRAEPSHWKEIEVGEGGTTQVSRVAYKINHGRWAAFRPAGWFEAKAHHGVLYARFIGDTAKLAA